MSNFPEPILRFEPLYQTRVWGGRALESVYGRTLPDSESPFGESWEISAREEADSVVRSGAYAGKTLTELWSDPGVRMEVFGADAPQEDRFPLLCKILDASDKLSIQVHPPADVAPELGGEPKTEVWYVAHAEPDAVLYVGFKAKLSEETFRATIQEGTAEACIHAIPVKKGDHIFIPSGRIHAIGAGTVIYEIQQNSDTTYRVYDWNRPGLNGAMRELHVEESLKCIDFDDIEPSMDQAQGTLLTDCELFRLERHPVAPEQSVAEALDGRFAVGTVIEGGLVCGDELLQDGDFFLIPKGADADSIRAGSKGAEWLLTTWPE